MTIQVQLPEALYPVFEGKARYRVAYGGRGSGKSWAFARMAVVRAYQRPSRILCVRELQTSIKDSVHTLLVRQIEELGLSGFEVGESFIRHRNGSEFIFKGIRTNTTEIKSMEGIDIAWVEEAQGVTQESWQILIPTIRREGSEIWVTFNPNLKTDPTSQRFIESPPPGARIAKINFCDNPWFTAELEAERAYLKKTDPESYPHVWEGEYKDPNQGGLVVKGWSFANIEESIEYNPNHRIYLTCDFNVDPMSWGLAHRYTANGKNEYFFFDEIVRENTNIVDTAREFADKYGQHTSGIVVTGDAAGRQRSDTTEKPNQTRYDVLLQSLSDFGVRNFTLDINRSNPHVESRIENWNRLICNPHGHRRIKVHPRCKQIIFTMENLKYVPGSSAIWEPTPKQIEKEPKQKFLRRDMFDAVSYLTWKYDPKVKEPEHTDEQPPELEFDV